MGSKGAKQIVREIINFYKINREGYPYELIYKLTELFQVIEDVYSVSTVIEIQEAIDSIGDGAGTIFIAAGTYDVDIPIDIDGCGSLVIYGHGDNTILKAADGITVFNITCCTSCIIKSLKLDIDNYTILNPNTQAVIINETNDNVVVLQDVSFIGDGSFGYGIEIDSDNCSVIQCNILSCKIGIYINNAEKNFINSNVIGLHAQYGVYLANSSDSNTITGNSCVSNGVYGIYLDNADYCILSNNGCNSNKTGIYLNASYYDSITSSVFNSNSENGIYITGGDHNTISACTVSNNDSNTANAQAGLYINASNYNTISGNTVNNNNNAGAGTGYGIYIASGTENVVAANNANGNDVDFMDSGTATTIVYYIQNSDELQDAIDSIGTKSGIININSSFSITTPITIDGNGSYNIIGEGTNTEITMDCTGGDFICINITAARSVLLENFKIDASDVGGRNQVIIEVDEANDNLVKIDNLYITGVVAKGWGINCVSDNIQVRNCYIETIDMGIKISGAYCLVENNTFTGMDEYGINCTGNYTIITNNICSSNNSGIQMNGADYCNLSQNQCLNNTNYGMYIFNLSTIIIGDNICTGNDAGIKLEDTNYATITGNTSSSNTTTGIMLSPISSYNIITGNTCVSNAAGYGIIIGAATCVENIVRNNNTSGNNWEVWDLGTNSDFEYRCSTGAEIQHAIDSIAAKSGIVHILPIAGGIQLAAPIDIDGGGDYIIHGEGVGTIIDCGSDRTAFNVSSIKSLIMRDFKIDSNDLTNTTTKVINIVGCDNVIIDNLTIDGDGSNGYGTYVDTSSDLKITNCHFTDLYIAIYLNDTCERPRITFNYIYNMALYGVKMNANCNWGLFDSNWIEECENNVAGACIYNASCKHWMFTNNVFQYFVYGFFSPASASFNTFNGNAFRTQSGQTNVHISAINMSNCTDNIINGNSFDGQHNDAISYYAIHLVSFDDRCSINDNFFNAIRNIGAGTDTCIYIANANTDNIKVKSNRFVNCDKQVIDSGTNNEIEYICYSAEDIQYAIDSIAAKSGTIHIISDTLIISTAIDVDGGGLYIIKGEGEESELKVANGIKAFNITSCKDGTKFSNFKINGADNVGALDIIDINEGSDHRILFEDLLIYDDGQTISVQVTSDNVTFDRIIFTNGDRNVDCAGSNCIVQNCHSSGGSYIIYFSGDYNKAINNYIGVVNNTGIVCGGNYNVVQGNQFYDSTRALMLSGDYNNITNNIINQDSMIGIYMYGASFNNIIGNIITNGDPNSAADDYHGILLRKDGGNVGSSNNNIAHNVITNGSNAGAGDYYGIYIEDAFCDNNKFIGNKLTGNDYSVYDIGEGTSFIYECYELIDVTDAVQTIDNNSKQIAIIRIMREIQDFSLTLNDNTSNYVIEGTFGGNTKLYPNGDAALFIITDVESLIIRNIYFDLTAHTSVGTPAIDINGGTNIRITGCTFDGDNVNSIAITIDTAVNVEVDTCRIVDTADGIYVNSDDNFIHDNIINSVADDGIHLATSADRNLITGNIIRSAGDDGILIDAGADDNQLSDNIITGEGGSRVADAGNNTVYGARYS